MATRIVRTGEAQDVLAYLNSFPDDRLSYIIDPNDSRQVVVENQKVFEGKDLSVGQGFQLTVANKTYFCKVIAQSDLNPSLILVEGQQLHNVKDEILFELNAPVARTSGSPQSFEECVQTDTALLTEEDTVLKSIRLKTVLLKSLASNIITIISDIEPLDLGAKPTRTSPDDGFLVPPPTRNSDGTRAGYGRATYAEENIPLTEYWLNSAKEHNASNSTAPVVAIMDTGIDFRYDWTMGHETIKPKGRSDFEGEFKPSCPLWFNESPAPTPPFIQKDYVGWNFVGAGRLASNQHPNPYDDDSANKHGTRIAAIIAQQTDWNVRLMILKTHDYRGVGTIFSIFCAFEYLLQHADQVKIINASWGYYGSRNALFESYMNRLEDHKIWFVNAAGNQSDFYDDYHGHELKQASPTERYPACFSTPDNRVVTVTTARQRIRLKTAPPTPLINVNIQTVENYSAQFVDVAVGAGHNGTFPEPLAETNASIKGSSYAAPYFSGRLTRFLADGLTPPGMLDKVCIKIPNSEFSVLASNVRKGYLLMADTDFVEEAY